MAVADSQPDLCRPRESPEAVPPVCDAGCSNSNNFGFAFNDINFSDRTLRIEIVPELAEDSKTDGEGDDGISDSARYRKRRRINGNDMVAQHEEQIINCDMPDSEEGVSYGNHHEEAVATIEAPACVGLSTNQIGRSTEGSDPSSLDPSSSDPSTVLRVKTIHISSPILAAKSRFFYKLFSNGMRESEQRHVTLRIQESEEAAFMDLLNFMYCNTLPRTSPPDLLEVLMAADKYEVASCMSYCCQVLRNMPMTSESALLYLDLPSSVVMADIVQPLIVCAKQFLASRYKDYTKFIDEVLKLPLAGIEQVFSSNDLHTGSEDAVCDFLLKWAQIHYPKLEERKEIVGTRLVPLIRFPFMSCRKLKRVLTCTDFDGEVASKAVLEAIFFKAEPPHRQQILAGDKSDPLYHRFVPRTYRYRPVKLLEFDKPHQQCVVYLDLSHEECKSLYPAGRIYSQAFNLAGQGFFLSAHCQMVDQLGGTLCFGLFLGMQEKGYSNLVVESEFATRSKPTDAFVSRFKGMYTFTAGRIVGYRNLLGLSWEEFIAEDSQHFINGVLHIRAEITIRK